MDGAGLPFLFEGVPQTLIKGALRDNERRQHRLSIPQYQAASNLVEKGSQTVLRGEREDLGGSRNSTELGAGAVFEFKTNCSAELTGSPTGAAPRNR